MTDRVHNLDAAALFSVLAQSKDATAVYDSYELHIRFANNTMFHIWGKDPAGTGKTLEQVVPELKGQPFIGMLQEVWRTGKAITGKDVEAMLEVDGKLQAYYFDFEYRAMLDKDGRTCAILHTATEVTDRIKAQKLIQEKEEREQALNEELNAANEELSALNEEVNAANEELSSLNEEYLASNEELVAINEELKKFQQERKVLYDEMELREARLEFASDIVLLCTIDIDLLTDELICSQRYAELFGFVSPVGLKRQDFFNLIHPDDESNIVQPAMKQAYLTGEFSYEVRLLVPEQPLKWIRVKGRLIYDEQHQPVRIMSTATDVTLTLTASQLVADAEERLRFALSVAEIGTWDLDIERNLVTWDDQCKELYGFSKEDVVPYEEVLRYIHPDDRYNVDQAIIHALTFESGGLYDIKFRTIGAEDSKLRWLHCKGKAYFNSENNVYRFLGVAIDITAEFEQAKALELAHLKVTEKEEQLTSAKEAAQLGLFDWDLINKIYRWDSRFREIYNLPREGEFTDTQVVFGKIHADDHERIWQAVKQSQTYGINDGRYDIEYRISATEHTDMRWVRAIGRTIFDDSGTPVRFIGSVLDISKQKAEEQRKSDFIGIVSHELRSPLTSLKGYVQMLALKADKAGDTMIGNIATKAKRQVDRMQALISGFLDVARIGEGKIQLNKKCFDMAELVKQAEEESLATITSHQVVFAPVERTPVEADQDKIEQVLVNFINNAVKYSPQGSVINVACITVNQTVHVNVIDQGMGVSPKDQPHLFDRFYRVENEQMTTIKGFGIGLYICKEIIEWHGGKVGVISETGKGSNFWFELPLDSKDMQK